MLSGVPQVKSCVNYERVDAKSQVFPSYHRGYIGRASQYETIQAARSHFSSVYFGPNTDTLQCKTLRAVNTCIGSNGWAR